MASCSVTNKSSYGARYCCAINCSNNSKTSIDPRTQKPVKFHKFPDPVKQKERCTKWIVNLRRADLNLKNVKSKSVCSVHFEVSMYSNQTDISASQLFPNAVPTLISCPNQSQSSSRPPPRKRQATVPRPSCSTSADPETLADDSACLDPVDDSSQDSNRLQELEKKLAATQQALKRYQKDNQRLNKQVKRLKCSKSTQEFPMMTRNIHEEFRRLKAKNGRLIDIVKTVARINVELLLHCISAQHYHDAKAELDRLACLINAIQFELKEDVKFGFSQGDSSELPQSEQDNDFPSSFPQLDTEEDVSLAVKAENNAEKDKDERNVLVVKISAPKIARARKPRAKLEEANCIKIQADSKANDISSKHQPVAPDVIGAVKQKKTILKNIRRRKRIDKKEGLRTTMAFKQGPCMCERCGKMFKSKVTLRCHIRRHREKDANLSYRCNICSKQFNLKAALQSHMKFHTSDKEFQCTYCGKCFIKRHILNLHIRTHSGEKPHVCNVCNKSFSLSCNLRRHEKIHTGERPWKCEHCGKSFNQSNILKSHIRIHFRSPEKKYRCTLCDKSFNQCGHLYSHSIRIHSKDIRQHPKTKTYECTFCQKQFLQRTELTCHIRAHTGDRPFQCSYCLKGFRKKIQLEDHTRTHTGFKPYKCALCDKAFTRKAALHLHINVHNGKVFACSVCNRKFNSPTNMTRHMRNHSGEKPFKCQVCSRTFGQKVTLDLHMWTHTSEKRFKCSICGKGYNDKRNLNSHVKTHSSLHTHLPPVLAPQQLHNNAKQNLPFAFVSMPNNLPVITCSQDTIQHTMSLTTHDGTTMTMAVPPLNQSMTLVTLSNQGPTLTPL